MKSFLGSGLPYLDISELKGTFVVLEGGDGTGRSTQISHLQSRLEQRGTPSVVVGIKRSNLVAKQLKQIMRTNVLCPRTLTLFYATDLADQLERTIIPALKAGFVVLADRYIYSLMARALVRGVDAEWLKGVFGFALRPDSVILLHTPPEVQANRSFKKADTLDYWESGQDMQIAHDLYDCFIEYQTKLDIEFAELSRQFNFKMVDAQKLPQKLADEIALNLEPLLGKI